MRRLYPHLAASLALVLAAWTAPGASHAATLASSEKAAEVVVMRNLAVKDGEVSGELVNRTNHVVRDVQLQIRHLWQWKNEFRPGTDELGRTVYHTVEKEISPGGSVPFSYKPTPPLPSRADGFFQTSVSISGYAEVYR
jgi:hypothetical protein